MSEDIQSRMNELERQNSRLKRMFTIMIALIAGALVLGFYGMVSIPNVVRARTIEILDRNGTPRIMLLGDSSSGSGKEDKFCKPAIQVFDKHGAFRVTLGLDSDEGVPELRFYDHQKSCRVALRAQPGETPTMKVMDRTGKELRWH